MLASVNGVLACLKVRNGVLASVSDVLVSVHDVLASVNDVLASVQG